MRKQFFLFVILIFTFTNCNSKNTPNTMKTNSSNDTLIDRQPAVAGQFYPSDAGQLNNELKEFFERAKSIGKKDEDQVVAVISPHAGYVFSGGVAASAIKQLDPDKQYTDIFIIGSSHRASYDGASIYNTGDFITPLGKVKVDIELANQLIKDCPSFSGSTKAHQAEHSLEVQLPFLQSYLKKPFRIVPILLGTQDPESCKALAKALKPYLKKGNVFLISSDFSHYPSYTDAQKVDGLTAKAIETNSPEELLKTLDSNERLGIANLATSLCGWPSVLTLLYMTYNNKNISVAPVEYKNSGDSEYKDKSKVVGYYAIKFILKDGENTDRTGFSLNSEEKKKLLSIAQNSIKLYLEKRRTFETDTSGLGPNLKLHCGAFVTLRKKGELRGCIGSFSANKPLYDVVQQMAIAAATEDTRFEPVKPEELENIDIEISVLTSMRKIKSIDEIEMGKHGIYIKKGQMSGTFLPQVATDTKWTKEEFLGHCARDKAGIGWDGWKDADLFVYEAYVFGE
jgi:MEMO1 family protein